MSLSVGAPPAPLAPDLQTRLGRVSFPTLGHHLEEGFVEPAIHRICGVGPVIGRAVTLRLTGQDSTLLHHAAGLAEPGDVFVIDMGGDRRHAPVGEVIAEVLHARGAAGIVVDGVVTDIDQIERTGLPIYARGLSVLTTKLLYLDAGGINIPVSVGGVAVQPGDVVLGDRNGLVIASPEVLSGVVDTALQDDAEEPEFLAAVLAGTPLGEMTEATATVRRLTGASASDEVTT